MTDDYDRRKDDRLEAGLCQWCGHARHGVRPCAVFLSGPAYRRPCKCDARFDALGGWTHDTVSPPREPERPSLDANETGPPT